MAGEDRAARPRHPVTRTRSTARSRFGTERLDAEHLRSDLDRERQYAPQPMQVVAPVLARDLVQLREGLAAMLRLEPALIGEARNAEIGTGDASSRCATSSCGRTSATAPPRRPGRDR